ncbi:MAG: ribosome biogenesis GTP-binding protein YihA/YsxC [Clostridiales bacterium]|nr:ribosome biogenesis GTP-binding protein YihA/YsxC [Clostridiales bacterium]
MKYDNPVFEAAYGTFAQLPPSKLPEIAFAGRSNVGKSSLLNKLFNRKNLARTSSKPGKTITINFFKLGEVRFVDLPGYGYAKVAMSEKKRWAEMMEGYFNSDRNIRLVVQLVDMRHSPTKDDLDMIDFLSQTGYNFIIVMTKCDKLNKTELNARREAIKEELAHIDGAEIIEFSAVTGEGTEKIKKSIESYLEEA